MDQQELIPGGGGEVTQGGQSTLKRVQKGIENKVINVSYIGR
jgi:hypothetical protein